MSSAHPISCAPPSPLSSLSKYLTTATSVAVVTLGGVSVPTVGKMQGVSMALLRMTQCGDEVLSEDETLPTMVHPLQFGIGQGDAKYARGAIVLLFYFAIPTLVFVATHGGIGIGGSDEVRDKRPFAASPPGHGRAGRPTWLFPSRCLP